LSSTTVEIHTIAIHSSCQDHIATIHIKDRGDDIYIPIRSWNWDHPEASFSSNKMKCKFQLPTPSFQFLIYGPPWKLLYSISQHVLLHKILNKLSRTHLSENKRNKSSHFLLLKRNSNKTFSITLK